MTKKADATTLGDILFDRRGPLGIVTLNRPEALNALTLDMVRLFEARLAAWQEDPEVQAVLVKGVGERAFCAGGDVRAIWNAAKEKDPLTAAFFYDEYRLNQRVFHFPKPYIALMDGVTMGGGVGISVHGSHRVATERTTFAMPETGIGLFPDVGASYFLPRLPGALGLYLGLTGARAKAADCRYAGITTHMVESGDLNALETALIEADWNGDRAALATSVIAGFACDPGEAPLAAQRADIDRCFSQGKVEDIFAALAAESSDWARKTLDHLKSRSPTSLKIAFRANRDGARLDFDAVMTMEYRLSQACIASHDLIEGIRAVIIDKDGAPQWRPAALDAVSEAMVAAYFEPLGERDLNFV